MAKYKIAGDGVKDAEKGLFIPNDPGNRHWQEYQEWLAEGNTPDPEFTQAELDAQAKADRIRELVKQLNDSYADLVALVWLMYDAGIQKNLWKTNDFDPKRLAKADEFKAIYDELDSLSDLVITYL